MPADVGVVNRRAVGEQVRPGGTRLLAVGAVVAAVAAVAYLVAIATHPMDATLKGFDLQVYLGGAHQALHRESGLYGWIYDGHPGIQFTYTPFAALVFAAGHAVSFRTLMALVTIVSIVALFATVWIAFRELGWQGQARLGATLLVFGLVLWTEPVQRELFLGQVELVLMGLITWDVCQPDGRPWKGAITGILAGIDLIPGIYILYLLITRRFRQAAVAAGAFGVTVVIGFIALPHASVTWWLHGDFFQASRTGFVGSYQNQSLRGIMTRVIGSVNGAQAPWLVVAVIVLVAGLAAAYVLDRRGHSFAALMAVALTGLLVSPISWDHHWVWIAPGLALIIDTAVRGARAGRGGRAGRGARGARAGGGRSGPSPRAAWYALAAVVLVVFAAWPEFWKAKAGLLEGGLINFVPAASFPHGDNPDYPEYHWHGLQLIEGNLELLAGLGLFAVLLIVVVRLGRSARA
jgi:alpha-1,2-mannosyltransferase